MGREKLINVSYIARSTGRDVFLLQAWPMASFSHCACSIDDDDELYANLVPIIEMVTLTSARTLPTSCHFHAIISG